VSPTRRKRTATRDQTRVLTDPRAIRALAHPARLRVLEALNSGEVLTATQCAEQTGVSPSAMSYHLRALEKWGFVERADSSDGRERPWRATAEGWRVEAMPDQVAATAANAVVGSIFEQVRSDLDAWFRHESDQPKQWRDATTVENAHLWLTAEEAAEVDGIFRETLDRFRSRTRADHPDDARYVRVLRVQVPTDLG
jgi:DNA-binding transcriptional ArsR family regulator